MKIGVVVPCLSQFRLAVDALVSVKVKEGNSWQPYIIPNYRDNNCVAKSWNIGTKEAIYDGCDYILVINDDILLAPFTVDDLVEHMEKDPDIALLSGTDYKNRFSNAHDILTSTRLDCTPEILPAPDFACFMLRPSAFMEIGDFDEGFRPAYFEDDDYCRRIVLHPVWKIVRSQNAAFFHHGSQTQNNTEGGPVVPSPRFEINRAYYREKWGGEPGFERWSVPFNGKGLSGHMKGVMGGISLDGEVI